MSTRDLGRQHGLTIIELVLFIVITGVAAAGIMRVLNIGSTSSTDPARRKQAMLIAESYMEEVQLARFTFCDPSDDNASTVADAAHCSQPEIIGPEADDVLRPFDNVNDYVSAINTAQRSFAIGGVDTDINGRPLGQDASATTLGNSSMSGITTTMTLNYVPALGPAGRVISSDASSNDAMRALRITIRTTYGTGPNDFIELDGYRTRYAPNYLP
ncbi:type IV pilus modification PilV family protein [Duganella sp. LjRoot269]|uniref:type IV pilus modification PilV family protein n=1 Tax=Duganella sp. LjRoot269 TaxID=3342305 RepID=UPI003ED003E7